MTFVVDPYLITIPFDEVNEDQVRDYAHRLLTWDETFRSQPDFVVSSLAMCAIYRLRLNPSQQALEALFERFGIRNLSAYDVMVGCDRLITNYPQMEERTSALDIYSLEGSENVIPAQIRERMHPEVAKEFVNALVATSYALEILEEPMVWKMATAPLDSDASITEMIVEGSVKDKGNHASVSRSWPLIFDPNQFFVEERIADIYDFDPIRATEIAWVKIKEKTGNLPELDVMKYRYGSRFLHTLNEPQFRKRPDFERDLERVFEAVVYVLTKLWAYPSDKHHPLRENIQDRTSPQQRRFVFDGSVRRKEEKAGRAEVLGGNKPLHLHFWFCHDGSYEFSNVTVEHNDPTIFE